MKHAVAVH